MSADRPVSADGRGAEPDPLTDALREARPRTSADDGWAATQEGQRLLAAIRAAALSDHEGRRVRILLPRPPSGPARRRLLAGVAGLAAAAAVAGLAYAVTGGADRSGRPEARTPSVGLGSGLGSGAGTAPGRAAGPAEMLLAGYDTCGDALADLRQHAAANITVSGLPMADPPFDSGARVSAGVASAAAGAVDSTTNAGQSGGYSGTNDQEAGADEPDVIKTDGRRLITVTGSTLRIVDVRTHAAIGSYDLSAYAGADSAQLLLDGDRALVLLDAPGYSGGPIRPAVGSIGPAPSASSTYLSFDLSTPTPTLLQVLHPKGALVGARLIDGVVRLVVRSAPQLQLTDPAGTPSDSARLDAYRAQVRGAPLSAWLPGYTVTTGTVTTARTVPCTAVSHPRDYSGLAMITVYSLPLDAAPSADPKPISLAADGGAFYASTGSASTGSLVLASDTMPGAIGDSTQLHRFTLDGAAAPTYVGSGSVPGSVADSYSLSEYDGALRVVTTSLVDAPPSSGVADPGSAGSGSGDSVSGDATTTDSALYVLDATNLTRLGAVEHLGRGERVYAVRLLGPLGYVVTFRQVDPLHVLDLRNPRAPRLSAALTVDGYSTYLHDVGSGHLLGIGQSVGSDNEPDGLQLSLFDVTDDTRPKRIAVYTKAQVFGGGNVDPHAFTYWASAGLAFLPISSWNGDQTGSLLAVRVGATSLTEAGVLTNPGSGSAYGDGISRAVVVGDQVWTLSAAGLAASDLATLHRTAWVPFR